MKRQSRERGRVLGRQGAEQLSKLSAAIVLLVYLLFASCRVLILKFCNLTYLLSLDRFCESISLCKESNRIQTYIVSWRERCPLNLQIQDSS